MFVSFVCLFSLFRPLVLCRENEQSINIFPNFGISFAPF